jgi:hypothetical protein
VRWCAGAHLFEELLDCRMARYTVWLGACFWFSRVTRASKTSRGRCIEMVGTREAKWDSDSAVLLLGARAQAGTTKTLPVP